MAYRAYLKKTAQQNNTENLHESSGSTTAAASPNISVFAWGSCKEGQLGLGGLTESELSSPRLIPPLSDRRIKKIACGANHSLILFASGQVFSCGNNESLQLGHNLLTTKPENILALESQKIIDVFSGAEFCIALNDEGHLFSWGSNSHGQLGRGDDSSDVKIIRSLSNEYIIQVACGNEHVLALTRTSRIYCWGNNSCGQLGIGPTPEQSNEPRPLSSLSCLPVRQIAAGAHHSHALTPSGSLYSWGSNGQGQLGVGNLDKQEFPCLVKSLRGIGVVYVSCGEEHSAVLTYDGGVFTFGAGNYGQLGHNDRLQSCVPRKVFELMGSTVSQLVCGKKHTMALVPTRGRLYAFGLGGQGQLGVGNLADRLSPATVKGPWVSGSDDKKSPILSRQMSIETTEPHIIKEIYAGGNHCFIIAQKFGDIQSSTCPVDFRYWTGPTSRIDILNRAFLEEMEKTKPDEPIPDNIQQILDSVFSSHACLSASFLNYGLECKPNHMTVSRANHGIDLDMSAEVQQGIANRLTTIAFKRLRTKLYDNVLITPKQNYPDVECLRAFLVLSVSPYMASVDSYLPVIVPFCRCICSLADIPSKIIDSWFEIVQPRHFRKLVGNIIEIVLHILGLQPPCSLDERKSRDNNLKPLLDMLKRLNKINEINNKIPYSYFCIPELRNKIQIEQEFLLWMKANHSEYIVNLCNYPFVYDGESKTILLRMEARCTMEQAFHQAQEKMIASLFIPMPISSLTPFFIMEIRRDHLVEDSLRILTMACQGDLKKPLKVKFVDEEAVDDGGVLKEFFLLIMKDLMNPIYGMFRIYPESRLYWFNESTLDTPDIFNLIGQLCGLAIYNNSLVDLAFPLALFSKLLDRPTGLEEFSELDPVMANSFRQLLDYENDDFEDLFPLAFEMTIQWYDQVKTIHLLPPNDNGEPVIVKQDNKQQYVDLYVDHVLNVNCAKQYKAFHEGFHYVCGGHVLKLFQPIELQSLVVGSEIYDWPLLRRSCEYIGEYWDKHPVIVWFWEVFMDMTIEEKKNFLRFLTGCDRIPITGIESLKIKIQPTGGGDHYFPSAHTCYNLLDLPKYSSKEILKKKLLHSILHTEGFQLV